MKRYEDGKLHYGIYVAVISGIVTLLIGALSFLFIWEKRQGTFPSQQAPEFFEYEGEKYVLKKGIETFLVLGLDKFESDSSNHSYNNDQQADFLMLFIIDNNEKTVSALHINRDTMTAVNILGLNGNRVDTATMQIALSHTYGNGKEISCHNAMEAVSKLLKNVKIDHGLSMKMDAVAIVNDLLGGVEVTLTEDFTYLDSSMVKGATVLLTGDQALHYVRSRSVFEDSSNIARMERQRQYMDALYNRAMAEMEENNSFVLDASLKTADYVISDCSTAQLQRLSDKFIEYEFAGIRSLDGTAVKGEEFMEFYPTEESIMKNVIELFYMRED